MESATVCPHVGPRCYSSSHWIPRYRKNRLQMNRSSSVYLKQKHANSEIGLVRTPGRPELHLQGCAEKRSVHLIHQGEPVSPW